MSRGKFQQSTDRQEMKRTADNELPEERLNKIPALGQRFDMVDKQRYQRMACAVDEAMRPETQRPIIIAVRDRAESNTHGFYDYDLAFKPSDRLTALHLLQSLDTMEGKCYEELVRALYDRNDENEEGLDSVDDDTTDPANKSEKLLRRTVGTSAVGEVTEIDDIDDYDPFLYWYRCYLNTKDDEDDEDKNGDSGDDSDSDDV